MKNRPVLFALALSLFAVTPAIAQQNNIGSCGWGSKLFEGDRGVAPQVLAVTTNGILGSQTFGISSGTSGCSQDGVVSSSWRTVMYIDENMNRVAKDMSVGEGDSLEALASLLGIAPNDRELFYTESRGHFEQIFPNEEVSSEDITRAIQVMMRGNPRLAQYVRS